MKTMKRKGFTLVELLVVIAILAILAGVGVAGYTAFIERAYVSNDNTMAAQLNSMLTYMKADSNGDFYNADIKEENVWAATQTILEEAGFDGLVPQSLDYGYHFYFNLDKQEFVVLNDKDVLSNGMKAFINIFAANGDQPGFFTYGQDTLFLVDTKGSNLADAVRGFYTFDHFEGTITEKWEAFKEIVGKVAEEGYTNISDALNNSKFVVEGGEELGEGTGNIVIHANAGSVGITNPTTNLEAGTTIVIPAGTTITNLGVASGSGKVCFVANSINDIKDVVDPDFVSEDITIVVSGDKSKEYVVDGANVYVKGDKTTPVLTLTYKNPVQNFDIEINDSFATNYDDNTGYIVYDKVAVNGIQLAVKNELGKLQAEDPTNTHKISLPEYTWEIAKVVLADDSEVTGEAVGTYATIDANTGLLKLAATYDFSVKYIQAKATAVLGKDGTEAGEKATQTFEVHVASVSEVGFKMAGKTWVWDGTQSVYKVTLIHDNANGTSYTLENSIDYNNKIDGMVFDETISVSIDDGAATDVVEVTSSTSVLTKKGGITTLVVKIGPYKTYKIEVTVADVVSDLAIQAKHPGIAYVGNSNVIELGDIFVGNIPENANVIVFNGFANDDNYMAPSINSPLLPNSGTGLRVDDVDYKLVDAENKTAYVNGKPVSALTDTIKLAGTKTSGDKISIAIFSNGVRVSPNVNVYVVDGKNVTDYSELDSNTSNVLLSDITMTTDGMFTLQNSTLYGNYFTFNIENGVKQNTFGIIILRNSTMRDTRVVGSLYPTVAIQAPDLYGSNAVHAIGNSVIDNCYIANCRAPLASGSEDNKDANGVPTDSIVVKNTVLYGGRYANVDLRGGTLTFEGKVIAVNQPHTNNANPNSVSMEDRIAGFGITTWLEAPAGTKIQNVHNLVQYNFIPETYSDIPTVTLAASGLTINANCNALFQSIFTDKVLNCSRWHTHNSSCYLDEFKYGDYHFEREGVKYINPGILGEDVGEGASKLVSYIGKELPAGDRTGYAGVAPTGYQYVSMSVATDFKIVVWTLSVTVHTYGVLNTQTDLFDASENAELIYSPWNQTVNNTTYAPYGFVNGNIIHD